MCYARNTHPMSSKFRLSKWITYFSQLIDKFFKTEEMECLIHYVKFNMWPALFYVNFLCFHIIFQCWCYPVHYFTQLTQGLKTGILNVALGWAFQFFRIDERDKKLEFSRLDSVW